MIKGCEVAPLGMVAQTTIDEKGNAKSKFRLTHDQRERQSRRIPFNRRKIWHGIQSTDLPH